MLLKMKIIGICEMLYVDTDVVYFNDRYKLLLIIKITKKLSTFEPEIP